MQIYYEAAAISYSSVILSAPAHAPATRPRYKIAAVAPPGTAVISKATL